jgi:hypothetical protein
MFTIRCEMVGSWCPSMMEYDNKVCNEMCVMKWVKMKNDELKFNQFIVHKFFTYISHLHILKNGLHGQNRKFLVDQIKNIFLIVHVN